jgi:hypothetical protein
LKPSLASIGIIGSIAAFRYAAIGIFTVYCTGGFPWLSSSDGLS